MSENPKSRIGESDETMDVGLLSTDDSEDTVERRWPGVRGAMESAENCAREGSG